MKQCGAVLHPWLSYSVRALLLKLWFCDVCRHGFERSEVINLLLLRMPTVKTHTMTNKNNLLAAGCDWIELNLPTRKNGAGEKEEDNDFCVKYFLFHWTTTSLCIKIMEVNVIHVFYFAFEATFSHYTVYTLIKYYFISHFCCPLPSTSPSNVLSCSTTHRSSGGWQAGVLQLAVREERH